MSESSRRAELAAAGLAAGISMGAYCLATAIHGSYPFGSRSRAVGDLGDRYVPFHAHLWDLMHGDTTGDLLLNWNSGYGAPFLADFADYLMNPFSWLVGLFPRSAVNFPVFLVTLLCIGLAAALMTRFLGRLHPGSRLLRALLAVGYGLCAWVLDVGAAEPMWMWGLVSLPLLCLAGDWCLRERHWVLGSLAVAVAWAGNYYTGAMATLGAALVLLLRVALLTERPVLARLKVLARAVTMLLFGLLLAAPVLTVGLTAGRNSQPAPLATYDGPPGPVGYLVQLLPGGRSDHPLPDVSVGVLGLLLVASLPFNRRVRPGERIGWYTLLLVVGVSFVWEPTVLVWHGLTLPEGSPYRAAFVLSGLLVMAAWVSLSRRPDPFALAGGAGVVVPVALLGLGQDSVRTATWVLLSAGGVLVLGALWLLERGTARRAVCAVLTVGVLAGATLSTYSVTVARDRLSLRARTTVSAATPAAHQVIRQADDWPDSRTDPGPHEFTGNDPLLIGGEGGSYSSENLPRTTAELLHDLGAGWYDHGRHTLSPADPVGRALFGVTTYLDDGPAPDGFTTEHAPAVPLITLRPAGAALDTSSVWSRQQTLLDATVYRIPQLTPTAGPAPTLHGTSGWSIPATPAGGTGTTFEGSCLPGDQVFFYGPWFDGTVLGLSTTYSSHGHQPTTAMPIRLLGNAPADGRFTVVLRTGGAAQIPVQPVGCLDRAALDRALTRPSGVTAVHSAGHSIDAELPPGSTGTALISVPAVPGWQCSVDDGPERPVSSVLGMIGVPLGAGASRLSCGYLTPGLTAGAALSGAALAVLVGVALVTLLRRRARRDRSGSVASAGPTFRSGDSW
ncbi:YfhO family protein [Kitasatospora sp. CMC57]|uniref:YfhO family protein n=1 Tax=Kitasatospora sp. CMC57 TaxID=3231513 RepID=A0AB33K018_9ACTN